LPWLGGLSGLGVLAIGAILLMLVRHRGPRPQG
jgi:hypothetical protein